MKPKQYILTFLFFPYYTFAQCVFVYFWNFEKRNNTNNKKRSASSTDGIKIKHQGVCHAWQKGECDRGDKCKFAHVAESPKKKQKVVVKLQKLKKVCHAWQKGNCTHGDACKFIHDMNGKNALQKDSNGEWIYN